MNYEQSFSAEAEKVMQVFYGIGLHMIGEQDGGIADMVEEKLNFARSVAMPMVMDVADVVGLAVVRSRLTDMLDEGKVLAGIEPICDSEGVLTHEMADQAASETAFHIVSAVYEVFPELGGSGLEKHMAPAAAISRSHLRSEANFREVSLTPTP